MMLALEPTPCPRCHDSGWIQVESDVATDALRVEPCGCQGNLVRRQRLLAANIPKRYNHCTLDTFRVTIANSEAATTLKNARERVQQFVDLWPVSAQGRGMLLMGPSGSGKTHLAVGCLLEIIRSDKPGHLLFSNFQELIQQIQASFESDEVPGKSELLRPLLEVDLLVLDELGSQKPTTFVQDILYYLINTRYNAEMCTVFTTNFVDEPTAKQESLADRISHRLRSRLYEMAAIVTFGGVPDYRAYKRNTL